MLQSHATRTFRCPARKKTGSITLWTLRKEISMRGLRGFSEHRCSLAFKLTEFSIQPWGRLKGSPPSYSLIITTSRSLQKRKLLSDRSSPKVLSSERHQRNQMTRVLAQILWWVSTIFSIMSAVLASWAVETNLKKRKKHRRPIMSAFASSALKGLVKTV